MPENIWTGQSDNIWAQPAKRGFKQRLFERMRQNAEMPATAAHIPPNVIPRWLTPERQQAALGAVGKAQEAVLSTPPAYLHRKYIFPAMERGASAISEHALGPATQYIRERRGAPPIPPGQAPRSLLGVVQQGFDLPPAQPLLQAAGEMATDPVNLALMGGGIATGGIRSLARMPRQSRLADIRALNAVENRIRMGQAFEEAGLVDQAAQAGRRPMPLPAVRTAPILEMPRQPIPMGAGEAAPRTAAMQKLTTTLRQKPRQAEPVAQGTPAPEMARPEPLPYAEKLLRSGTAKTHSYEYWVRETGGNPGMDKAEWFEVWRRARRTAFKQSPKAEAAVNAAPSATAPKYTPPQGTELRVWPQRPVTGDGWSVYHKSLGQTMGKRFATFEEAVQSADKQNRYLQEQATARTAAPEVAAKPQPAREERLKRVGEYMARRSIRPGMARPAAGGVEGALADEIKKSPHYARLLVEYEDYWKKRGIPVPEVEARVKRLDADPVTYFERGPVDTRTATGRRLIKTRTDILRERHIGTQGNGPFLNLSEELRRAAPTRKKRGGALQYTGATEHERARGRMIAADMRKINPNIRQPRWWEDDHLGAAKYIPNRLERMAAKRGISPLAAIEELKAQKARAKVPVRKVAEGVSGEPTWKKVAPVRKPPQSEKLAGLLQFVRELKGERGSFSGKKLPTFIETEAKRRGLDVGEVKAELNRAKWQAKQLEQEKWLTQAQARRIRRELTAPKGSIEGMTTPTLDNARLNKLIASLSRRTGIRTRRQIVQTVMQKPKITGATFEQRRTIASMLLKRIPEGHQPEVLSKALGKSRMAQMTPKEVGEYIATLKRIPSMKEISPLEFMFGSPYRIWPKLGATASDAHFKLRQFVDTYDTRLHDAAKSIKGPITGERKAAIFNAVEHTFKVGQDLPPEMVKAMGSDALPFVHEARKIGDELFTALKTVNPSVKYRGGHILHYWKRTGWLDRMLGPKTEALKPWEKRFEQMPVETPTSAKIRTAGEFERKGAGGYERDPFAAISSEIRRVGFKVHMEPVLRDIRAAVAEAPKFQKVALEQWMGSLKGKEGMTDAFVRAGIQWVYDHAGIKRQAPYKPLTKAGSNVVRMRYDAVLAANPGPVVKNFFQRVNTFAEYGDEPTAWARGVRLAPTKDRLALAKQHGVIEDFEAKELLESFHKGFARRAEEIGMKGFNLMERANRAEAFSVGYEWARARGMSEAAAIAEGKASVANTQFLYGRIGMAAAFRNPVGRVALQLGSWPAKQTEWMARHIGDAIKARKAGNTAEFNRHLGVVLRYTAVNGGLIVGLSQLGIDAKNFLGFGQFDFRNPMAIQTAIRLAHINQPVSQYELKQELKKSWLPGTLTGSKVYQLIRPSTPQTPKERVMRFLSLRSEKQARRSKMGSQLEMLDQEIEVAERQRDHKKARILRRKRQILGRRLQASK